MLTFGERNALAVTYHITEVQKLAHSFATLLAKPRPDKSEILHYQAAMAQEMRMAGQHKLVQMTYGDLADEYPPECAQCQAYNLAEDQDWHCPYFDPKDCERADAADAAWEMTR